MATTVIYNDVELHNVLTKGWDQEIVYDSSNTDVLFCRYKLQFSGIVHAQFISPTEPPAHEPTWIALRNAGGDAQSTADISALLATIKAKLAETRKPLQIYFGEHLVLDCVPRNMLSPSETSNRSDLDNGPKPKVVSITHVGGSKVFRITFSIECAMVRTHSGYAITSEQPEDKEVEYVLSNRWSINETLDDKFFTTRTIRGKMRVSSPDISSFIGFKDIVVPSLETGFRRDRIEYTVAENKLDIEYAVTDRQVHIAAPWPAVKMDAKYSESTDNGTTCHAEVYVKMEGTPSSSVPLLIQRAFQVVNARIQYSTKSLKTSYQIEGCTIVEHIGESNAVEVNVRVMHLESVETVAAFVRLLKSNFTGKLPLEDMNGKAYDQNKSMAPKLHGYNPRGDMETGRDPSIFLTLLECYQQNPWGPNSDHAIGTSDANPEDATSYAPYVMETTVVEVPQGELESADNTNLSDETLEATYTYVRAETKYHKKPCRVQMPLTGELTESDDTCLIVDLGGTLAQREIHVDAERIGKPPEIPEPVDSYTDGELTGTLLDHWERALPPTLAADKSQKIYRIEAYYLYALNRPPKKTESTRVGVLQNTKFTQAENSIMRSDIYTERMKVGE